MLRKARGAHPQRQEAPGPHVRSRGQACASHGHRAGASEDAVPVPGQGQQHLTAAPLSSRFSRHRARPPPAPPRRVRTPVTSVRWVQLAPLPSPLGTRSQGPKEHEALSGAQPASPPPSFPTPPAPHPMPQAGTPRNGTAWPDARATSRPTSAALVLTNPSESRTLVSRVHLTVHWESVLQTSGKTGPLAVPSAQCTGGSAGRDQPGVTPGGSGFSGCTHSAFKIVLKKK